MIHFFRKTAKNDPTKKTISCVGFDVFRLSTEFQTKPLDTTYDFLLYSINYTKPEPVIELGYYRSHLVTYKITLVDKGFHLKFSRNNQKSKPKIK